MKKVFALITAFLLALCCFACSGGESGEAGTEYTLRVDSAVRAYTLGDEFVPPSVVSLIEKKDGKVSGQTILGAGEYEVDASAFDSSREGDYEIKITYSAKNLEGSYTVSVKRKTGTELVISGQRSYFRIGDAFDVGNLQAVVRYADKTEQKLTAAQYTVDSSAYVSGSAGEYEISVSAPDFGVGGGYNVYVNDISTPDYHGKINILGIGNSYTQDGMAYLPEILRGYGFTEVNAVALVIGGSTLAQHCENIRSDSEAYEFEYNYDGTWKADETATGGRIKHSISSALSLFDWDIIVIQQQSIRAGLAETYGEDFDFLSSYVANATAGKHTRVFWQMTWAYRQDFDNAEFETHYGKNEKTMYDSVVSAVKSNVLPSPYIAGVIPSGTAVQNMRTGSVEDITRDGFHMNLRYGRYTVGLTWAAAIAGVNPADAALTSYPEINSLMPEIKASVAAAIIKPYEVTEISA